MGATTSGDQGGGGKAAHVLRAVKTPRAVTRRGLGGPGGTPRGDTKNYYNFALFQSFFGCVLPISRLWDKGAVWQYDRIWELKLRVFSWLYSNNSVRRLA